MSSDLARQQQQVLQALWLPRQADALAQLAPWMPQAGAAGALWSRGLAAYRAQGAALAERVLAEAFPVVSELLGSSNFAPLAQRFWRGQPPVRGDLAQWGGAFADFIASLADLVAQEPYLPDVARIEWALHAAATAADGQTDAASFGLLATCDPAQVALVLAPGTCTVRSAYPAWSVVAAHRDKEPSLEEAGQRLRAGTAETARVWRQGLRPRVQLAQTGEADFIAAVQEKQSLLDALGQASGFDFAAWLAPAVQDGLLLAVRTTRQPEEQEE